MIIDPDHMSFWISYQKTDIYLGKAQIRTDHYPGYSDHRLPDEVFCFLLKNIPKLFLNQFGIFLLSFAFHVKYLWYKFSEILGQALISTQSKHFSTEALLRLFFKANDPFRLIGVAVSSDFTGNPHAGFFQFSNHRTPATLDGFGRATWRWIFPLSGYHR